MTDATFWKQRWQDGMTGWHRNEVHPTLIQHWSKLAIPKPANVLVPLCGRALALGWLQEQGHYVTGIELSELAARGVFEDCQLTPRSTPFPNGHCLQADRLSVMVADLFECPLKSSSYDAIWDRAALVALEPSLREAYRDVLLRVLKPQGQLLLNAFDFPPADRNGPPFALSQEEVQTLFGSLAQVELLESIDKMDDDHRSRGYTQCFERIFKITKSV